MSLSLQTNVINMVKISEILSDKSRNIDVNNSFDYIELSRKGLRVKQLHDILDYINISTKELAKIISLSERQINRYKEDDVLRTDISAQLIQIVELYTKGYELFEDQKKFQRWMNSEIQGLGNVRPISLLDTIFGIQLVVNELGRLEHGVYS